MRYQVMPDLTPLEFAALKADIAERGVLVAVELDEDGELLDGHHRVRAWGELRDEGVAVPDYPRVVRTGLSESEKRNHARRLNVLRRQLSREQRDEVMRSMRADGATYKEIAQAVGVSTDTAHRITREVVNSDFGIENERGQLRPSSYQRSPEPAPPPPDVPVFFDDHDDLLPFEEPPPSVTIIERAPQPEPEAPKPHVAHNSGNNEWYTPAEYIAAARRVMGEIDLDPASSAQANEVVQAARYFTAEDDGLAQPWSGRVWMNPPYAAGLVDRFAEKLVHHVSAGEVTEAIVLVNNATETGWFQRMARAATAICFFQGRVRYWRPDGGSNTPLQGQALFYFGDNVDRFSGVFSVIGLVMVPMERTN